MDTMQVVMQKTFSGHNQGEQYELDAATAKDWIDAGIALEAKTDVDTLVEKFSKDLEERDSKLVAKMSESLKAVEIKTPKLVKENENPEENFFVAVGRTSHKDPVTREKAFNLLANKYGQTKDYTGMAQGTTTAGGFLVPVEYVNELLLVEGYDSVAFPQRVRVIPTTVRTVNLPALDQTGTPSDRSSAFYGNVAISVKTEGVAPDSYVQPAFKQVSLAVKKVIACTQVSNELLSMSPISVEGQLTYDFRGAVKAWIDGGIFQGDGGSSDIEGLVDNAATIQVRRKSANKVTLQDLANMWARMAPQSRKRAVWVINPSVWGQIPWGSDFSPAHFVTALPNIEGGMDLRIFGCPIVDTECLPTLGSAGDVMLCDLSKYVIALNKNIAIDSSPHFAFPSDLTTYRLTCLLDGKPQLTAPIKLQDGTTTVSPFIQLDDPTS